MCSLGYFDLNVLMLNVFLALFFFLLIEVFCSFKSLNVYVNTLKHLSTVADMSLNS